MGILTQHPSKSLDVQPGEINNGELIDVNGGGDCDQKDEGILKDAMLAKHFILKEVLEIFHNIGSTEEKMPKAYSNLERNMTVLQGLENMVALYPVT